MINNLNDFIYDDQLCEGKIYMCDNVQTVK